jgi:predicted DNA-binding transcriptional regulator AlpA
MIRKLQDSLAYPPRAMRLDHAAAYLSVSRSTFLQWVDEGKMPQPIRINGVVLWDRLALDVAFEAMAAVEEEQGRNSFDKLVAAIKR